MKLAAIPLMISMIPRVLRGLKPADLPHLIAITRASFPSVQQISTRTLAQWIEEKRSMQLIDVRSDEEFEVSHLPGAKHAQTIEEILRVCPERSADVVVYCAVGFRSCAIASKMRGLGFNRVASLEGSIFQWANEGRPLYRGNNAVDEVHLSNPRWSGLLAHPVSVR